MVSVGSIVAGYRIERVLGTGGMGTVYLAKNPTLPRYDALKVLDAELSRDRTFRDRFIREADIVSAFDHPNIVSVYGRGETSDGELWIALQYVNGTDAEEALRSGKMTPRQAIHIVTEVAKALDYAHQRNVVHHDVKPANLLLAHEDGALDRVLLTDFGVARPIDDTDRAMDGAFTATLAYSAPEVITGEYADGRADLYSLGCTLFRLLTGKQPYFQADDVVGTIRAHLQQTQPLVSDHLSWATPDVDAVIAKALAKDPAQRYTSAREFAAAAAAAVRDAAAARQAGVPVRQSAPPAGEGAPAPYRAAPEPPPAGQAPYTFTPSPARTNSSPPAAHSQPLPTPESSASPAEVPLAAAEPEALPPPAEDGQKFSDLTDFRSTIKPRRQRPQLPKAPRLSPVGWLWTAAAVLAVIAAVLITVVINRFSTSSTETASSSTSATAAAGPDYTAQLRKLLPAGYPAGACTPATSTPAGARAAVSCTQNTDPGGPASATYTLAQDSAALQSALNAVITTSTQVVCPGNIQSPGPWRRNANPTVPAGTLYCATTGDQAIVAWTTDSERLLSVTRANVTTMDDLYRWWTSHS
ncbi:serine/threonine protein kinase (plasmid) [Mycobacterium sp. JS623]|uniref:serine/threonine-protein kinase n=1 Tax=Mycobacterium sp. JS623 TaxID=212767 RepID=UPI0002A57A9C|nr:serine/threonine-protein kinase [Mycobacterium sp. JS623]AGB27283.1 serine/threonine protein kinase [Mycobacterium sp. JS623]